MHGCMYLHVHMHICACVCTFSYTWVIHACVAAYVKTLEVSIGECASCFMFAFFLFYLFSRYFFTESGAHVLA